ncbi:MAG TPA: hypothetical protein VF929_01225, partial [Gemmatimonadaceae bacterium]
MSLRLAFLIVAVAAVPAAAQQQSGAPKSPAAGSAEKAAKIASATSAAPASISAKATIAYIGADGKMITLRAGTNGWVCLPDNPGTPKPDPMCADKAWQEWMQAWMAKKTPA